MKIKYNGPSPLLYRSAPSETEYMFNPGEEVKIDKADNEFFTNMSKAAGSSFELCGAVKKAVEEVKTVIKTKPKQSGGNK